MQVIIEKPKSRKKIKRKGKEMKKKKKRTLRTPGSKENQAHETKQAGRGRK